MIDVSKVNSPRNAVLYCAKCNHKFIDHEIQFHPVDDKRIYCQSCWVKRNESIAKS